MCLDIRAVDEELSVSAALKHIYSGDGINIKRAANEVEVEHGHGLIRWERKKPRLNPGDLNRSVPRRTSFSRRIRWPAKSVSALNVSASASCDLRHTA